MATPSNMFDMTDNTINPNLTMQDNSDLNDFFNPMEPASTSTNSAWSGMGMGQFIDINRNTEFPFPQTQNSLPFGVPPQALNTYIAGPMNNAPAYLHGVPVSAGFAFLQTAAPSALMDTQNPGYTTRQATSSSQKAPRDSTNNNEASTESTEKKPRKQRKKRSKQLSEAEANEKRQKFLDRNKAAAHKCRQRKKEWTDNLSTKASAVKDENDRLKIDMAGAYYVIDSLKAEIAKLRMPGSVHTCNFPQAEKQYEEFLKREANGFADEASIAHQFLRDRRERERTAAENDGESGFEMSRRTSQQSGRSAYVQTGRTERHDSGVSLGNTPEDAKTHDTPKASVDEGIDLDNGRNFFGDGNMMPNQRLGMWGNESTANGPDDLMDPAVYLGLVN
ncbi:uncharacterized protein LY89DRAFT_681345 [Mollisia scopiformis]|uniref:BZIP domain-containing protein n=1 Tax=Mollisia scopiformis TaxID=149040 RepID=A0A194XQL1_MOLSC|nr:uncharacterized protein LY89DRAFT_681345 [Mollisia scopiformis]KUJ22007.1 hypothetical protein LY89DRAFT_681345 [Mollisia scopiformis]